MKVSSEISKENLTAASEDNKTSTQKGDEKDHVEQAASVQNKIDEEKITIDYLHKNHDFFNHHPAILGSIEIPHESGAAVSLIERQIGILREQNTQQKIHLAELIEIANDNEKSNQRIHKLILSLLDCNGIDACEVVLDDILCDDFSVDAVALRLFVEPQPEQPEHLFIKTDSVLSNELDKLLNTRKPMCGYFKKLPLEELFEDKAQSIASLAILPLYIEKNNCFGALIMASNNVRRFSSDSGTLFLERLGETLSHVVNRFLNK